MAEGLIINSLMGHVPVYPPLPWRQEKGELRERGRPRENDVSTRDPPLHPPSIQHEAVCLETQTPQAPQTSSRNGVV